MYCLYILYILKQRCAWNPEKEKKKQSISGYGLYNETKKKLYFTIRVLYFKCSVEEHFAKAWPAKKKK